jgi:four helix bundle protein
MTRDFRQLQVWEKAHALTLSVYNATATFPKEELYGLTAQMRRSAASVPMNIAEGCGRSSNAELNRFLLIASGSARELEYQLLLASDLGILDESAHSALQADVQEVQRMLAAFTRKLQIRVYERSAELIIDH